MLRICCHTVWFTLTLGAADWFISSVGSFIHFQGFQSLAFVATLGTAERFFTGVGSFMFLQDIFSGWYQITTNSAMLLNFTGHFSDWQKESQTDQNNETFTNNMNKYKYDWGWQVSSYSLRCMYLAGKSAECDEQQCFPMCDNSSFYMYFKKLGFSGFSHPVEPEIRIFLH